MYFPLGDAQLHEGIRFNLISVSAPSKTEGWGKFDTFCC